MAMATMSSVTESAPQPPRPTRVRARYARRWAAFAMVVGLLITLGFAYRVAHKPGVYWAQVDVLFLPPPSGLYPNTLLNNSGGLITLAGVVGKMVDPDSTSARVVSPTVRLANQGVRHGDSVTLPNDGGQWADNFDKALLDVQAVGSNAAEVDQRVTTLVRQINAALTSLQDRGHVPAVDRATTRMNPGEVQVFYDSGRRSRALATTLVLGIAITLVGAGYLRRRLALRQ
jgi:hypothetical protein